MNRKQTDVGDASGDVDASSVLSLRETERRLQKLVRGKVEGNPGGDASWQAGILNALPANIALLDGHGYIISVNDGWRQFARTNELPTVRFGVGSNYLDTCDRAHGVDCVEAVPVAEGIRAVLAGRSRKFSLEYPCHSATQQRWFLLEVTPLAANGGEGVVVMHMNITERRQAQAESRLLSDRLADTLDSMSDAFFTLDRDWRFTFLNKHAELLLGRGREVLLGRSLWEEYPTAIGSVFEREYRRAMSDNVSVAFEADFQRLESCFSVRAYPSEHGLAIYFRDVTEARRAAEGLRTSEEEFRKLAEAMPQIVWITRADGWNTYFNQQWSDYTGLTLADGLGHGWSRPFHPADRARAETAWQEATDTVGMYSIECRLRRADGAYRWWLIRGVPVRNDDGQVIKWFGTCTDIHDRKVAELEVMRANQGLRASELRIKRLNRVYAVLSQINALIVRKPSRDELFQGACRIAVELGEFRFAWCGLVDRDADLLSPIASAGDVDDFFECAPREVFECRAGTTSQAAHALHERAPQVVNDFGSGQPVLLKEDMEKRGIRSFAIIPLVIHGDAVGVFALYAQEAGFFDEEEVRLLRELAGNMALALENIEKQERLDFLAYYDPLTGLANRSLFLDRVSQHMRSAAGSEDELALVLFDLERFKNINDSLGREAGDALLQQVSNWVARRAGDAGLLARVGPNQFAAVMPRVRPDGNLSRFIENAMASLGSHPFEIEDAVLRVTVKVGVALFPKDGTDAEALFQNAEAALRQAKANGDRYLFHSSAMTAAVAGKLSMENQLRRAFDNEEFVLHFQPKVSLATGKVTGAEALIRWNDPATGLVPPGRFIPVLEETGLIHDVGRWAMCQAIECYLRWCDDGLAGVRIAVNVSSLQLRNRGFVAEVAKVLSGDPRAASGLELEITESMVMGDINHGIDSLQAIRNLGVTVALDDFGTGFSSLSYLARLPIDTLKIDRSFINNVAVTTEGLALVSTIITLAHSLRHTVVAEGVESAEQARLLRSLDCDEMQGFHFGRPVPCAEFEALYLAPLPA
ncbi:bifunctional diguanylate cyclase/phosphodiesterase [Alkalisalibacterium limincola]|nr:bifunctional diguanylate cyclase/phosphodiesterase [Alkalisalibacterium limincola]